MTESPVVRVIDCHVARETPEGFEFLLLRRAPDRADANRWRIVTGKIEHGEAAWQAALRELREETALAPLRLFAVPYVNQFYEWQHDRINAIPVFLALVPSEAAVTLDEEHTDSRWFPAPEAAANLTWPGMRDGLLAAEAFLADPNAPADLEIDIPPR
jgi:dATP pyrophosphohydrolase